MAPPRVGVYPNSYYLRSSPRAAQPVGSSDLAYIWHLHHEQRYRNGTSDVSATPGDSFSRESPSGGLPHQTQQALPRPASPKGGARPLTPLAPPPAEPSPRLPPPALPGSPRAVRGRCGAAMRRAMAVFVTRRIPAEGMRVLSEAAG